MVVLRLQAVTLATVSLLSGCALWPSEPGQMGDTAPAAGSPYYSTASAGTGTQPPALGTNSFEPPGVTMGGPTGTFVGQKVTEMQGELRRLQDSVTAHNQELQDLRVRIIEDSQRYHGTVAAINTRLQVGTTPGNPILVQQFNGAKSDLDRLSADIGELNQLGTAVTADSTMASFLGESVRATFRVSGAVDEDHRNLAILQDEVDQTSIIVDRLLSELSEDIRRQTEYVSTERGNLNLLASGIRSGQIYGASLINQAIFSSTGGGGPALGGGLPSADISNRRPLVVIRFDRPNVPYQQAVYNAVSKVIERRPDANIDLVAVAPSRGGAARVSLESTKVRRQAENVMRSLVDMGLPPSRIAMLASTSPNATTNEVHLYVR